MPTDPPTVTTGLADDWATPEHAAAALAGWGDQPQNQPMPTVQLPNLMPGAVVRNHTGTAWAIRQAAYGRWTVITCREPYTYTFPVAVGTSPAIRSVTIDVPTIDIGARLIGLDGLHQYLYPGDPWGRRTRRAHLAVRDALRTFVGTGLRLHLITDRPAVAERDNLFGTMVEVAEMLGMGDDAWAIVFDCYEPGAPARTTGTDLLPVIVPSHYITSVGVVE